jgi:small-conductance mechanosensitive channel
LVVVGGEEGYVRKISVRSTEVETSERARVLIPNSYFITEKVKNWTLRDTTRRIVIPISVGYGCDARKVRATLLKVAQDNPNVMTMPAPSVDFDFGADTLNFKLYAFVDDLDKGGSTSTELRFAILDAFNEAGIAMPFQQKQAEVTSQNLDWLREAATEYMSGSKGGLGERQGTWQQETSHQSRRLSRFRGLTTDPRQTDILQADRGWWGIECNLTI